MNPNYFKYSFLSLIVILTWVLFGLFSSFDEEGTHVSALGLYLYLVLSMVFAIAGGILALLVEGFFGRNTGFIVRC